VDGLAAPESLDLYAPDRLQQPTTSRRHFHPQWCEARMNNSWEERLARNARPPGASRVRIKLFGIPAVFAASLGLMTA
jgi:hypothetical protein